MTNTLRPVSEVERDIEYIISDRDEILSGEDKSKAVQMIITTDRTHTYTLLREQMVKKRRFFRDMGSTNFNQGIDEAISILDTVFNKTETK